MPKSHRANWDVRPKANNDCKPWTGHWPIAQICEIERDIERHCLRLSEESNAEKETVKEWNGECPNVGSCWRRAAVNVCQNLSAVRTSDQRKAMNTVGCYGYSNSSSSTWIVSRQQSSKVWRQFRCGSSPDQMSKSRLGSCPPPPLCRHNRKQ